MRKAYRKENPLKIFPGVSRNAIGAASEYVVCIDLLYRGYTVFKSVTHYGECDVIALKNGEIKRIEVKTAHKGSSGRIHSALPKNQIGKHDVLAQVVNGKDVVYSPDIL